MAGYEEIQDWWNKQAAVSAWSITPVTSGCSCGVVADLEVLLGQDFYEISDVSVGDAKCSFVTGHTSWTLTADTLPTDKWGNTATYNQGISLIEGCYEVYYGDDGYRELSDEWIDALGIDLEDVNDFIDFIEKHYPELIDRVGEELVCNGTLNFWSYITTNKAVTDSKWQEVIAAYLSEYLSDE